MTRNFQGKNNASSKICCSKPNEKKLCEEESKKKLPKSIHSLFVMFFVEGEKKIEFGVEDDDMTMWNDKKDLQ